MTMNIQTQSPRTTYSSIFNRHANPHAPAYAPEVWNDLGIDAKENVRNFFNELNGNHYDITHSLQIAGLLSLKNIVGLVEENDFGPEYSAKSRITRLLSPEDVGKLADMVRIYFSAQQARANCYAYAINFMDAPPGAKPDPGMKTPEYQHGLYATYTEAIIEGAREDGLIQAGTTLPDILDDHYRAALFIKHEGKQPSFHWVREDNNGGWSSKDGHGPARNTDYAGHPLIHPQAAFFGDYTFECYFHVPKQGIVPIQFRR